MQKMIQIYFDGKCGLCSKEIRYYQHIATVGVFAWYDVATDPAPLQPLGVDQADALRRLHAMDSQNKMHIGVDAFIVIWRHLPRWHLLAAFISIPGIRHFANFAYARFADYRFKRLPHCQIL